MSPVNQIQTVTTLGRHDETVDTDNDVAVISGASVNMLSDRGLIQGATPATENPDPTVGDQYDFANPVDTVYTGIGDDLVSISNINDNAGIRVFLGDGNDQALVEGADNGVNQTGAEIYGESGEDRITGSVLSDTLNGGADHDRLSGGGGDDSLLGESGNDLVFGGDGQDELFGGNDNDWLYGGGQSDHIEGGDGSDKIYGDTELGSTVYAGVEIHSPAQWDGANEGFNFYGPDVWWALPGNPTVLDLPATQDVSVTEVGDDTLSGGKGNDFLFGGGGQDELFGGDDADQLYGEAGDDRLFGDAGNDILYGDKSAAQYDYENEILYTATSQTLGLTVNQVRRQHQDPVDVAGNDALYGGSGIDRLYGGGGNDVLDGGTGNDRLEGGTGDDEYVFNGNWGRDIIKDDGDVDTIRFGAGIHASEITVAANDSDLVLADQNGNEIHIRGLV